MKVLIGCERSGVVRRAFAMLGHDAWSCDTAPSEDRSNKHLIGDVRDHLRGGWDLLFVAHPPCTRLCNSGVRWLHAPPPGKSKEQMWRELDEAAELFSDCWNAPIARKAIENPIMHRYAKQRIRNFRPHSQVIQPYQFGHPQTKATCLWLEGLPKLIHTQLLPVPEKGSKARISWERIHRMPPGPQRGIERSRTFEGIAQAMAIQWGGQA